MDSPSGRLLDANTNVAGLKRPPPSLLPAFEPSSSPPRFKRQKSRVGLVEHENRYPTPVPSSSLGLPPSSPPAPTVEIPAPRRPLLQRTQSTVSERSPLTAVPSIQLPENGEPVLMGRSSNSSHYRLSANRLISRVHVKAAYICACESNPRSKPKVTVTCMGWNGVKVHCQGHAWELQKGDQFTSETENAEIMLDVQDSRVLLLWPICVSSSAETVFEGSPLPRFARSPSVDLPEQNDENVDPRESARRMANTSLDKLSPVSPTPRRGLGGNAFILPSDSQITTDTFLEIYEDEPVAENDRVVHHHPEVSPENNDWHEDEALQRTTRDVSVDFNFTALDDDKDSTYLSFQGEPGLPPVRTFGTSDSKSFRRSRSHTPPSERSRFASSPPVPSPRRRRSASLTHSKVNTVQNHITNQLAFSRVAATPLTELFENLPAELAHTITKEELVVLLDEIECIGEVKRHGKDAAGKPLESQYYYIADKDDDEGRRTAVGGRAGLRNCRKTHKQYYWRKPKKPAY